MFVTKEKAEKIVVDELQNIKCDICGRNLLKGKDEDEEVSVATLRFSKSSAEMVREEGFKTPYECESSDFCEKCYRKIVEFVKKLGGKVPSYYFSDDEDVSKILGELFS